MRAPSQEPMKVGTVDVEAFSRNLARLVEEGGRALAAYLKPREQGRNADGSAADEVAEVVKTLGQVAEYWLADPQRSLELQTRLGKAYLDLWASGGQAARRRTGTAGRRARGQRQALCRPGVDLEPVLRLPQASLSAHHRLGQQAGQRRRRPRSAHQAESRFLRSADHQCPVAVEFRADQSRTAARNAHQQRREPGSRHAYAGRGHRRRRRRTSRSGSPMPRCSRSDAISRPRPARSSSRTT